MAQANYTDRALWQALVRAHARVRAHRFKMSEQDSGQSVQMQQK